MNRAPRRACNQAGFTLIEIMVVVVIIGLLATIVSTNVLDVSQVAEIKKAGADVKQIDDACRLFMTLNGGQKVPSLEELRTEDHNGHTWLESGVQDPWHHDYVIRELERGKFEVISFGPDGIEGTADDLSSKALRQKEQ